MATTTTTGEGRTSLLHLLPFDREKVSTFLESSYSPVQFGRKEAWILRELNAQLLELLVSAREEAATSSAGGESARSFGVNGQTPSPLGTEFGGREVVGGLAVRENELVEGSEAIVRLIRCVCEVYGISLDLVQIRDATAPAPANTSSPTPDDQQQRAEPTTGLRSTGTWQSYGWPELQLAIMRETLSLAQLLPDYPTVAQLALTTIRQLGKYIPANEQHNLYTIALRAMATARRRGDPRRLEYWSENPLVRVEGVPLAVARLPTPHALSELQVKPSASEAQPIQGLGEDPFLYNPRLQTSAGTGKVLAVQNERLEFLVTLKNPHPFDFDLQSVELSTSGIPFQSQGVNVVLPASGHQVLRMSGVPLHPGTLTVRGCTVQVSGCLPRTFFFSLPTKEDESRQEKRQLALELEFESIKSVGLDARPINRSAAGNKRRSALGLPPQEANDPTQKFLECTIVPEQPLMRVKRSSLTYGALMLYSGETASFTLTLENISPHKPVNFLRVTFDDSTIPPAQAALAEGELSTAEQYETEYELVRRPVFIWEQARDAEAEGVRVEGGKKTSVGVRCLGKVGCTSGTVLVSYGSIPARDSSSSEEKEGSHGGSEQFYTRQIVYPVLVTVYHHLQCEGMDIIPFSPAEHAQMEGMEANDPRRALVDVPLDEAGEWCLFMLDVRNAFGVPFEVTLERTQDDAPAGSSTRLIPPHTTLRLMLPLKRQYLPPTHTNRPIPTLLPRQFLVSKDRLSSLEEKEQRTLFWYREHLFSCVRAGWREVGSGRWGEVGLRGGRMRGSMVGAFRAERVRVELCVRLAAEADEEGVGEVGMREVKPRAGKYEIPANEFVYLSARVTNVHSPPAHLTLSLTPLPPTPTAFVLHEGSLSDIPLGLVEQGQTVEREICMVFVAEGRFDWAAGVRICGEEGEVEEAGRREVGFVARGGG